jgi:hypothetical protein
MKKRVIIFVSVVLLALAIVPVINLKLGTKQQEGQRWWSRSILYNFDFALPYLSRVFYPLGISISPNQVIIGKDNWLYLGDKYVKTVTSRRTGATVEDIAMVKRIGLATKELDQWLKLKGVSLYQVMLAPNKATIYSEFLPDWARSAANTNSVIETLLSNLDSTNVSKEIYVDTKPALMAAKAEFSAPLYYKTDTHWDSLGAWVAFRAFAKAIDRKEYGLRWLSDQQVHILDVREQAGGDLANFLRMAEMLQLSEVIIKIDSEHPIETEQYDFEVETGHLTVSDGKPKVGVQPPLLIKSKYALNQKKVLWLHDSFGGAMSPFMAATFTETLKIQYGVTDSALLAKLVDTYKPDYVFITVVERAALAVCFENLPPVIARIDTSNP